MELGIVGGHLNITTTLEGDQDGLEKQAGL